MSGVECAYMVEGVRLISNLTSALKLYDWSDGIPHVSGTDIAIIEKYKAKETGAATISLQRTAGAALYKHVCQQIIDHRGWLPNWNESISMLCKAWAYSTDPYVMLTLADQLKNNNRNDYARAAYLVVKLYPECVSEFADNPHRDRVDIDNIVSRANEALASLS